MDVAEVTKSGEREEEEEEKKKRREHFCQSFCLSFHCLSILCVA